MITAGAATANAITIRFDSSCLVKPKLQIRVSIIQFLDVSVIPSATRGWEYCCWSGAGSNKDRSEAGVVGFTSVSVKAWRMPCF